MKNRKVLSISYLIATAVLIAYVLLLKYSIITETTYVKVGVFAIIIAVVGYGFVKSKKSVS